MIKKQKVVNLMTFESLKNKKKPLIAAHRGLAVGNIPCNTPVSYEFALRNGAAIIDLDVALTKDRQLLSTQVWNLLTPTVKSALRK